MITDKQKTIPGDKQKTIPDYSLTERRDVPEDFKWRAGDLYSGPEAWRRDQAQLSALMEHIPPFAKTWTDSPADMHRLLSHLDDVEKKEHRLFIYANLLADTDMGNSEFQAMRGAMQTIDVELSGMLTFMNPDILKLGQKKLDRYIAEEPRLETYRFGFQKVLRLRKHILPSDKARIVTQTGLFSRTPGKAAGILNDLDMPAPRVTLADGKKIRLNTAAYNRHRGSENAKDRRKVMRTFWKHHTGFKNTHAALLDGAIKSHFFHAGVHRYDDCLSAALTPADIDTAVYHTLVLTVKDNLEPLHRYLKLKARMLGLDKLNYDDIYASSMPAVEKTYTYAEAQQVILEAMKPLGDAYCRVLENGFSSGWTDIYPNKGKRSGAYSNGSAYDDHPYVLMNYNGKFSHVSTLAHEFGHALHSWFSNKTQPYSLSHYPIFLAEIASTFNENLLVHHLVKTETDDRFKLYILDQFFEGFRGTLYRQTLFADFELAMHREVEQGRTLTPDWLNETYLDLTRKYYGHKQGVVRVDRYIENEWSGIPHFYYNFYVYQYSTGIVASTALADMVLNGGEVERERYLTMLKSGGSKYPLDTLKDAGVDLTTPRPIQTAITKYNDIVTEMEAIVDRLASRPASRTVSPT